MITCVLENIKLKGYLEITRVEKSYTILRLSLLVNNYRSLIILAMASLVEQKKNNTKKNRIEVYDHIPDHPFIEE